MLINVDIRGSLPLFDLRKGLDENFSARVFFCSAELCVNRRNGYCELTQII
ncbi:MAG: hypothetical protein IJQ82_06770 [Selenomonadaceae bacterium]|nr:hypothetical protein [Selenomonadaceae bacterium]